MRWTERVRACWRHSRGFLSPAGLLARAALIGAAFLICHAAGLRHYTTVLSGSSAAAQPGTLDTVLAAIYLTAYFGVTLLTPVLATGAGVLALTRAAMPDPTSQG
jgi:hypothetical protein